MSDSSRNYNKESLQEWLDKADALLEEMDEKIVEQLPGQVGGVAITGHYGQNIINKTGGFGGVEDIDTGGKL